MEYVVRVDRQGRLAIPAPIRKRLGLDCGGKVVFRVEGSRIIIEVSGESLMERVDRWMRLALSLRSEIMVLSSKLNEPLINIAWSIAYDLHVWGFHEASLAVDHVRFCMPYVSKLFERTCELVRRMD